MSHASSRTPATGRPGTKGPRAVLVACAFLAVPAMVSAQAPFSDVTTAPLGETGSGGGFAWGDYDNDGAIDLYLAMYGANKLLRNLGNGTFVDVTSGPLGDDGGANGVAWGDYDNDGDLDLYIATDTDDSRNKLLRNDGNGAFGDATGTTLDDIGKGESVAWGDYNNDGDLDLYVANGGGVENKLFRNEGNGAFGDATSTPLGDDERSTGVAWADYDNDGDLDLYLANTDGASNHLFRNEGNASFVDATGGPLGHTAEGRGVAWADYDNDGDLDLYLANRGTADKLFRNDGNGAFVDSTGSSLGDPGNGTGVAWGDYDNDGDVDLYLVKGAGQANRLYRNEGNGSFGDATAGPLGDTDDGITVAWADYDNDGDLDLYLFNYGTANRLLRNDNSNGNHWLHVDLEGTISNRSGIGARVRVVAGGVSRIEEVSGGSGWRSQNSLTAEFGLGSTATIDSLIVSWPSGYLQVVTPVPSVDQKLLVVEDAVDCNQNGVWDETELVADWARSVMGFSSQFTGTIWAATQALGIPNTFDYGDYTTAWAPLPQNGSLEFLTLGFRRTPANGVTIRETYGNGFVYQVDLVDTLGTLHTVWSGADPSLPGAPADFSISFPTTTYLVEGVKVYVDTDHDPLAWEEIDAVRLHPVPPGADADGNGLIDVCEAVDAPAVAAPLPHFLELVGARPNPFRSSTNIVLRLPESMRVTVRIYDVTGRSVRTLVDAMLPPGERVVTWDGRTADGRLTGSGIYFYRFQAGDRQETRKLVRIH